MSQYLRNISRSSLRFPRTDERREKKPKKRKRMILSHIFSYEMYKLLLKYIYIFLYKFKISTGTVDIVWYIKD